MNAFEKRVDRFCSEDDATRCRGRWMKMLPSQVNEIYLTAVAVESGDVLAAVALARDDVAQSIQRSPFAARTPYGSRHRPHRSALVYWCVSTFVSACRSALIGRFRGPRLNSRTRLTSQSRFHHLVRFLPLDSAQYDAVRFFQQD